MHKIESVHDREVVAIGGFAYPIGSESKKRFKNVKTDWKDRKDRICDIIDAREAAGLDDTLPTL